MPTNDGDGGAPGPEEQATRERRNRLAGRVLLIALAVLLAAYLIPMAIR